MPAPYSYHPLKEPGEIRLLYLEPARNRDAILRGSFEHIVLPNNYFTNRYTALSYVWGNSTPAERILLESHEVGITANLGAALRDLRHPTAVHQVWIDALCIDQLNIPERNQQVAFMRHLYSSASSTIIYLGQQSAETEFLLGQVPQRLFSENLSSNNATSKADDVARYLLEKPWFHRVWTFQELVLSRDPWVQCGSLRVRWADLCSFILPMYKTPIGTENVLARMNQVRDALHLQNTDDPDDRCLWKILEYRQGAQATDPRDMIWANMGLHSDHREVEEFVKIDYNKTIREAFIEAGRYVLKNGGLQRALSGKLKSPLRSILPWWVPDWGVSISPGLVHREYEEIKKSKSDRLRLSEQTLVFFSASNSLNVRFLGGILPAPSEYKKLHAAAGSGLEPLSKEWMTAKWVQFTQDLKNPNQNPNQDSPEPIDWDKYRNDWNWSSLQLAYESDKFYIDSYFRLAILSNDSITIVGGNVVVGDSIIRAQESYFYDKGYRHNCNQDTRPHHKRARDMFLDRKHNWDANAHFVIRDVKPDDAIIFDTLGSADKIVDYEHCRLIGSQYTEVKWDALSGDTAVPRREIALH
ncbi:HET-domain-containing protein [Hypoxylon trugodes]|uniref:HET-domain-containing protein n=1 Tax=Hypoxylon trugodes TaxID=326681 RepID=UPI00218CB756|nr:HET-domain-containing protein [Hypoxylon trugodes]KAI1386223.1 HET-domain-containing protein [Hypoxylon trugodes]